METKLHCKKASFLNETQALLFIAKLKKTSIRERNPQSAYLCPQCFNWHITSLPYSEPKVEDKLSRHIRKLQIGINKLQNTVKKLRKENLTMKMRYRDFV